MQRAGDDGTLRHLETTEIDRPVRPQTITGIVLVALGVVALAYQGITYTSRGDIIDLGPLTITTKQKKTLPLPPVLGILALVGGVVLLVMDRRRN